MSLFPLYVFILFLWVKCFINFPFSLPQEKNTFQPSYFSIFCLILLYFWFTFNDLCPFLYYEKLSFFYWVVILEVASCNLFINVWCWYFSSFRQCVALTTPISFTTTPDSCYSSRVFLVCMRLDVNMCMSVGGSFLPAISHPQRLVFLCVILP